MKPTQSNRRSVFLALILSAFTASASAAATKLSPEQSEFFEKKIRPVLVASCYQCHSAETNKVKGGLYLDSREALLKGGDSGPAFVSGKPDKSLLIKAIRGTDPDMVMPPKGDKLTPGQIADFEKWIVMGAPDPREATTGAKGLAVDMAKAKAHWAFQPIANPATPKVKDSKGWVQTPIDAFVLAKLQEKGLTPSPKADKRTLIRRATFDLTGLPPTPDEVSAFLADNSKDAFAKVVDRLLASARYGERWGRHWLDVARYADSSGDRAGGKRIDPRYPYAWTYRDYVINAFNQDLPYDKFILQQIAADKLSSGEGRDVLAAMGFLTVGKRFMGNENEVIDDRIDVVMQGLMGLTAACARCHDHKFDPIPTKDYYSLHGVFASSMEPSEEPIIAEPKSKEAYEDFLKQMAVIEDEVKAFHKTESAKLLSGMREKAASYLLVAHTLTQDSGKANRNTLARKYNLEFAVLENWEASMKRWAKNPDAVLNPWFAFAALAESNFAEEAKKVCAELGKSDKPANALLVQAFSATPPASMDDVSKVYGRVFADVNKAWNDALASAKNSEPPRCLEDPNQEAVRQLLYGDQSPVQMNERVLRRLLGNQFQNRENAIRAKAVGLRMTHPGSPAHAMVLEDSPKPRNSRVFVRGEPSNVGPVVPRQFLEILAGDKREPFKNGSGRLELAEAIVRRDNPLTARVLVNRVWQRHFGEAIVRTPSDFGLRSEPPTHPQLLDHLATWFMDHGWSLKKLHRQIMLSSVYQQDSKGNEKGLVVDPANQWLWRMNLQRLDFEEVRDSLLFVGGTLDYTMGGPSVSVAESAAYRGKGNPEKRKGMDTGADDATLAARRTVYALIDRDRLPELFRIFDFANPDMTSGQRFMTTVPQQALFMMNSPLVADQAKALLRRPEFQSLDGEARVKMLYRILFQRTPGADDVKVGLQFVKAHGGLSPQKAPNPSWKYGIGVYNPEVRRLKNFTEFNDFTDETWKLKGKAAVLKLDAHGGQTGPDQRTLAVRRWVSPVDGFVSIEGTLAHQEPKDGAGVQAAILSSRSGELGRWTARAGESTVAVARVEVKKGDTIDFLTGPQGKSDGERFTWVPTINLLDVNPNDQPDEIHEWDALAQFHGPLEAGPKGLNAWEKFAQVLLLTNEFIFLN